MDIKSLEAAIERAWEDRANLSPSTEGDARTAVNSALELLDEGPDAELEAELASSKRASGGMLAGLKRLFGG